MEDFELVIEIGKYLLYLLVLWIVGCYVPWKIRLHWPKVVYLFTQKEQVKAKVIEMKIDHHYSSSNEQEEYVQNVYSVWFMTEYGERLKMVVPEDKYWRLAMDDEGVLTHKGRWFLDFHSTRDDEQEPAYFKDHE